MSSLRNTAVPTGPPATAARRGPRRIVARGWRRSTLTDVARRAGVSRMTIYRRWPDMQSLVADLMTREWSGLAGRADDRVGRERLAVGVAATVAALRGNELFRTIVEVDPELLLPYLLQRPAAPRTRCSPGSRPASWRAGPTARYAPATRPCWPARCCSRPTASACPRRR